MQLLHKLLKISRSGTSQRWSELNYGMSCPVYVLKSAEKKGNIFVEVTAQLNTNWLLLFFFAVAGLFDLLVGCEIKKPKQKPESQGAGPSKKHKPHLSSSTLAALLLTPLVLAVGLSRGSSGRGKQLASLIPPAPKPIKAPKQIAAPNTSS